MKLQTTEEGLSALMSFRDKFCSCTVENKLPSVLYCFLFELNNGEETLKQKVY